MLVILATHPIQYQVPIWRHLARNGRVPFEVWYLTAHGVAPSLDREFGKSFQWDLPMLEGYPYRFVPEPVPGHLGGFWAVGLGADFRARLEGGTIKAILVPGWNVRACWEAVYFALRAGIQVWMRGDSNDLKVDKGLRRFGKRWLLGQLFVDVHNFLCVGEANRRLYRGYGIEEGRLASGPHCVDNARFATQARELRYQRQALRRAWGIQEDALCVLYAAKFISKKRPFDLVAAVQRLSFSDKFHHYHLLFVGSGELGAEVRQRCRVVFDAERQTVRTRLEHIHCAHSPVASFTGFLNQSEMARAYVAADALVLASDTEETWGLVVNEAMASGLPCVVSDACGCAEDLVVPLDPRLCYPCGDVEALAASIRWLADHPPDAAAIAARIARYDVGATAATLEQLWAEIAEKR
jgi:glycosyltransferase involved in cell wall biosynthesis